jgi:hypothetical protein
MSSQAMEVISVLAQLPVLLKKFIDTVYALAGTNEQQLITNSI